MAPRLDSEIVASDLSVSVVVCAYTDDRWEDLKAAIASIERQSLDALETIVVIDHNPELARRASLTFKGATVVENSGEDGLSGARNTGLNLAMGDIIAFLDDDAVAHESWLRHLILPYVDAKVIGVGGSARPSWAAGEAPRWMPSEFLWTVGCSYRGLPSEAAPVRNPIGASMSFRRAVFREVGGFKSGIGRRGSTPLGCEETELAIRACKAFPGSTIVYTPTSGIDHLVPAARASWRYFRSRCWAEGISKARVAKEVGPLDALASERSYVAVTLPRGVLRGLTDAAHGDLSGLLRATTIVGGLLITASGYLYGRVRERR